jgi:glycosyltransferase involved in cell wall biosynthesis
VSQHQLDSPGVSVRDAPPLPSVSVVVPVYNSEQSLPELVRRLGEVLPSCARVCEVILVNDGSRDSSWAVVQQMGSDYGWVRGIDLMRNYGQHNALLAGIRAAQYETVITMDDDLQHPPEEIPRLLDALDKGFDVVYGTPDHGQHGLARGLASGITKLALQEAMGATIARQSGPFRAFRTTLRDAFADYRSPHIFIDVLLTWGTRRFGSVTVRHEPRRIGSSNYTLRMLLVHAANMTTGFSTLPLQVASLIGFAFTVLGLVLLCIILGSYLFFGSVVPGFPFLASIVAIFSGAQLLVLGIIGEYLARMHVRLMDRPAYVVRRESQADAHE